MNLLFVVRERVTLFSKLFLFSSRWFKNGATVSSSVMKRSQLKPWIPKVSAFIFEW